MAKDVNRAGRPPPRRKPDTSRDVFINCPFDDVYQPVFNAIVFTVVRSGYRARCARESDDGAENRLGKIIKIIGECPFAVHDISRTETDGDPPLPRFNMPLELGVWFGAKHLGGGSQAEKQCIVFDREQYRYQRFMSDIGGQDIHAHGSEVSRLVTELSAWLRHLPGGIRAGGGEAILREYTAFEALLPYLCAQEGMVPDELRFADFNLFATEYVARLTVDPATVPAISPMALA